MAIQNKTITTGGLAQDITPGVCGVFEIRNESAGDLRITWDGQTPSSTTGFLLRTGEAYSRDKPCFGQLRVWGATTGQAFSVEVT